MRVCSGFSISAAAPVRQNDRGPESFRGYRMSALFVILSEVEESLIFL